MTRRKIELLLAAAAGVASYAAGQLPEPLGPIAVDWGAGVLFGLLVLQAAGGAVFRRIGLVAASSLVYRGAVWAAVELTTSGWEELWACGLAGAVAAPILALVVPLLGSRRPGASATLLSVVPGLAGGLLIGLGAGGPDSFFASHLPLLVGYVVWQVGWTAVQQPGAAAPGG